MTAQTALIICDLEGITGIDRSGDIVWGAGGYPRARELLTREVGWLCRKLMSQGFEAIRIGDSHMGGHPQPNLVVERLPGGLEVVYGPEAYAPRLFDDIAGLLLIGMHAAAETGGFCAHTFNTNLSIREHGQPVSEAGLLVRAATERGIPILAVSGDQVLEAQLGEAMPYVRTKEARSPREADSHPWPEVQGRYRQVLARAPCTPPPAQPVELRLRFKNHWQQSLTDTDLIEPAPALQQIESVLQRCDGLIEPLLEAIGMPGDQRFAERAIEVLHRPFPGAPAEVPLVRLERLRDAFVRLTAGSDEVAQSVWALTLFMVRSHAPDVFAELELGPCFEQARQPMEAMSAAFPPGLDPYRGQARLDAWFLRRRAGLAGAEPVADELRAYLLALFDEFPLLGWLLDEMARREGIDSGRRFEPRLFEDEPLVHLYWLTHLYLLESEYLLRPLTPGGWESHTEELLLAVSWIVGGGMADLAGEVAICLQCVGEERSAGHVRLIELLLERQQPGGEITEAGVDEDPAHSSAAALVALAGARQRG